MNELLQALKSEDETDRLYAAHDIAKTQDAQTALPLLLCLEKETSQVVKDAIVYALKSIPCASVYDKLFALYSSSEAYLRNQAVTIFGSAGNEAVPYLSSKLDHTNQEVRKLILDALFKIGSCDAVLAIRAYIHDKAQNVKIAAVEYLGELNDKESIPELISLFKSDSEAMLRSSILDTLSIIGDAQAIKTVVDMIRSSNIITAAEMPVYLPHLIDLVCKSGDQDDVVVILKTVGTNVMFADDIVAGILFALRRHSTILLDRKICDIMLNLLMRDEVRDDVRLMIAEILGNKIHPNVLTSEEHFVNGKELLRNPALIIGGLNLLKVCGSEEAYSCIREELDKTNNVELKSLYEDLLNGTLKKIHPESCSE